MDLRFVTAATQNRQRPGTDERSSREHCAPGDFYPDDIRIPKSVVQIPKMAETVEAMVRDSMAAFERRDDESGTFNSRSEITKWMSIAMIVFQELVDEVTTETRFIQQALDLILISRNLERIADHATNIAENVVFMVLGKDIRHRYNAASST